MRLTLIEGCIVGSILFLIGSAVAYPLWLEWKHPCLESHIERRHQPAWVEFQSHKYGQTSITVPIHHAARDYDVVVCDQRKK